MRVVVPPVSVGGRILRVISPTPHLYEVEEWVGEWWEPSLVTLSVATGAPSASEEALDAAGVPAEDRACNAERLSVEELSAQMRSHMRDYTDELPISGSYASGPRARRRQYTGSSKFRRPRAPRQVGERRGAPSPTSEGDVWTGPLRRATDHTRETPQ